MSTDYLSGLNEEQRQAVLMPIDRNILIVAGAGTGKTTALSRRVAHLLAKGVQPSRIVCCTFTNKATSEMRERIAGLASEEVSSRVRVGTLHSIASRIVGTHHRALGIEKRPLPLDEDASVKLIVRAWQTRSGSLSTALAADAAVLASAQEAGMAVGSALRQISQAGHAVIGGHAVTLEACIESLEGALRDARAKEKTYAVAALGVIERLQLQGLWPPEKVLAMGDAGAEAVRRSMISEKENSLFIVPVAHGMDGFADLADFMAIYQRYLEIKTQKCVMDFGDMVVMATRILRENPQVLGGYQSNYDYLMVDECQDLNSEQYAFIRVLSGDGKAIRVLMVGDQDQSVYAFRGANCMLMGDPFIKTFNAEVVMLTRNYRSVSNIVEAGNAAIALNRNRIPKTLVANNPSSGTVHPYECPDEAAMATWARGQIQRMLAADFKASEIAIISRRNDDLGPLSRELTIAGIPNKTIGSAHMFESPAVREALNWAIFCLRNDRDDLLGPCLAAPSVGLGEASIARLESEALSNGQSVLDYLQTLRHRPVRKAEAMALARYRGLMEAFGSGRVDVLMDAIVNGSFGGAHSMRQWNDNLKSRGARSVRFLDDLVLVAREVQSRIDEQGSDLDDDGNAIHPVEELLLFVRLQAGEIGIADGGLVVGDDEAGQVDAVQLMTIHKAKGLEFDVVFYINADNTERLDNVVLRYYGEFAEPNGLSDVVVGDVEESRRIAYVAMTRARRVLVFARAAYRMFNGTSIYTQWSEAVQTVLPRIGNRAKPSAVA